MQARAATKQRREDVKDAGGIYDQLPWMRGGDFEDVDDRQQKANVF
jgi:hypothetical protein